MDTPLNSVVKDYSHSYQPVTKYTYSDLQEIPEDGKRYEIINGELFMSPSPFIPHQRAARILTRIIDNHVTTLQIGEMFFSPCDVLLSENDVVQPDIVFILNENKEIITEKHIKGAPDFLIEILSPSNRRRDVKEKHKVYEQYGVKEYWIVDPDLETIQKFILKEGKYEAQGIFEEDAIITSDVITGLAFEAKKVFFQP